MLVCIDTIQIPNRMDVCWCEGDHFHRLRATPQSLISANISYLLWHVHSQLCCQELLSSHQDCCKPLCQYISARVEQFLCIIVQGVVTLTSWSCIRMRRIDIERIRLNYDVISAVQSALEGGTESHLPPLPG